MYFWFMLCKCKKIYIYINKVLEKMYKLENIFYIVVNIYLFYGEVCLNFKNSIFWDYYGGCWGFFCLS